MTVRLKDEDLVRAWVITAEHDLLNIEIISRQGDPVEIPLVSCTTMRGEIPQSALVSRHIDPPKIHDLTELYALLPDGLLVGFNAHSLEELNPYSIEGRYPGVWEPVERAEALRAVEVARAIRQAIRRISTFLLYHLTLQGSTDRLLPVWPVASDYSSFFSSLPQLHRPIPQEALARRLPSGEKANPRTGPLWPLRVRKFRPVDRSQNLMVWSSLALTKTFPVRRDGGTTDPALVAGQRFLLDHRRHLKRA